MSSFFLTHACLPLGGCWQYFIFLLLRLFKVLRFVSLGLATLIGKNKSLLRPLMLGSLAAWGMMP
jgi:hypothetical protein